MLSQAEAAAQAFPAHLARYWAFWVSLSLSVTAAGVGLYTGLYRLVMRWDYPYDHSWLVLGMTGWLLWRAIRHNPVDRIAPSFPMLAVLLLAVLGYALCEVLEVSLGMHVSLPLILLALLASLAGLRFARVAVVPLAMLYFTIPIWDLTIPPLQAIAVRVVAFLVAWTGPVAYTVGNVITIPSGSFEIAEGCSGMRYFMVSLAIAAFIGLSWYDRWKTRLQLLVVAGFAAMASNWIRIYTLILIGDATEMQHYVIAKSHDGYGWFVYVVCLLPVLWLARVLDRREIRTGEPALAPPVGRIAPPAAFLACGVLAAVILLSPAWIRGDSADPAVPHDVRVMPYGGAGWVPVEVSASWQPEFHSPYFASHEALLSEHDVQVDVYVARYLRQRPGAKLVSNRNRVSPDWQQTASRERQVTVGPAVRAVRETEIARGSERRLVWQWYLVGGRPTIDRLDAKLLEVRALAGGRRDGGVLALSAACAADCAAATDALAEVARIAGPRMEGLANGAMEPVPAT